MNFNFSLHTEKGQWGYHIGDLQVTARPKVLSRATDSILMRADSIGGAHMTCMGVRGGELAHLDFKKAQTLDALCAKWLIERGCINISDLPDDLQGEVRNA